MLTRSSLLLILVYACVTNPARAQDATATGDTPTAGATTTDAPAQATPEPASEPSSATEQPPAEDESAQRQDEAKEEQKQDEQQEEEPVDEPDGFVLVVDEVTAEQGGWDFSLGLELGFGGTDLPGGSANAVRIIPTIEQASGSLFNLGGKWPLVAGGLDAGGIDQGTFLSGNPFIYNRVNGAYFHFGFSLPFATFDDNDPDDGPTDLAVLTSAMGTDGNWDMWLYSPDTVGLVLHSDKLRHRWDILFVGGELGAALLVRTADGGQNDFVLQMAAEVGAHLWIMDVGARAQSVLVPTVDGDMQQLALVPFASLDLGVLALGTRLVLNVDEPGGFSFSDGSTWGLHFTAAANM